MRDPANWHRDPEYYINIIRAHEFAERQNVSLLEINGIGKARIRALWKTGINTADALAARPPEEVAAMMATVTTPTRNPQKMIDEVAKWQKQIRMLKALRHGRAMPPRGWPT